MDEFSEKDELHWWEQPGFGGGFAAGVLASLLCVLLFLCGMTVGRRLYSGRTALEQESEEDRGAEVLTDPVTFQKLDEVQSLIEQYYLGEVDSELLESCLFKGIAVGLDDLYANYYSPEELQSVLESDRGRYIGIGAVLRMDAKDGTIVVDEIYGGMPAEAAGLEEGDVLKTIGDTELAGKGLEDVVALIRGNEETFPLGVYRPQTGEELTLSITCGDVDVPVVLYERKEPGIGYIRITEFTENAVDQFREAAEALQEDGLEALIVDLRDNPGGLLTSVCDILDEVLPEGLIVYTEDNAGNREEYHADRMRTVDCEIAVLVNGGSASASEIFTGAIQDYGLGPVIGTKTFGKGIVQKTYPLSDGSAFKMTAEKYYTPKGQDIQGNGITPDITVEESGESTSGEDGSETDPENAPGGELPEAEPGDGQDDDPVLAKALEVLREDIRERE